MVNGYIWPSEGEVSVLGRRFGKCDVRDLRRGEVHSQGETREVLTKRNLTDFFEIPIDVRLRNGRAWARIIS